jgi:hypothetical protein
MSREIGFNLYEIFRFSGEGPHPLECGPGRAEDPAVRTDESTWVGSSYVPDQHPEAVSR